MTTLETQLTHRMNENCQTTAIHLPEISDLVTTVKDSQQKMWRAIKGINNDLQELIQKNTGTDEEDDVD